MRFVKNLFRLLQLKISSFLYSLLTTGMEIIIFKVQSKPINK